MLATNIAETAITIDDIVCVINSGRLKEKSFDPYTSVSTLQVAVMTCSSVCVRIRASCNLTHAYRHITYTAYVQLSTVGPKSAQPPQTVSTV